MAGPGYSAIAPLSDGITHNTIPLNFRESSFNMTRGGGMKILRGGSENFLTPKRGALKKLGEAPKICIL